MCINLHESTPSVRILILCFIYSMRSDESTKSYQRKLLKTIIAASIKAHWTRYRDKCFSYSSSSNATKDFVEQKWNKRVCVWSVWHNPLERNRQTINVLFLANNIDVGSRDLCCSSRLRPPFYTVKCYTWYAHDHLLQLCVASFALNVSYIWNCGAKYHTNMVTKTRKCCVLFSQMVCVPTVLGIPFYVHFVNAIHGRPIVTESRGK